MKNNSKDTDSKILEKAFNYCLQRYNNLTLAPDCKSYKEISEQGWNYPYFNCDSLSDAYLQGYLDAMSDSLKAEKLC